MYLESFSGLWEIVKVFTLKSFTVYSMYGTIDIYSKQAAEEQRQWLHQQYIEKDK